MRGGSKKRRQRWCFVLFRLHRVLLVLPVLLVPLLPPCAWVWWRRWRGLCCCSLGCGTTPASVYATSGSSRTAPPARLSRRQSGAKRRHGRSSSKSKSSRRRRRRRRQRRVAFSWCQRRWVSPCWGVWAEQRPRMRKCCRCTSGKCPTRGGASIWRGLQERLASAPAKLAKDLSSAGRPSTAGGIRMTAALQG